MTRTLVPPVLVTGATGRVGRAVIDQLVDAGVPVRALTHRAEAASTLPANVEVVTGDLTVPESLDAGLRGVGAVFLVWTVPPATAPAVVERLATYARRVVFLSSPHQTQHPFFQQPNPIAVRTLACSAGRRGEQLGWDQWSGSYLKESWSLVR
jgi:uncharacterized protein YbjT (DUF2867 family)